jgi:hypothetical protein
VKKGPKTGSFSWIFNREVALLWLRRCSIPWIWSSSFNVKTKFWTSHMVDIWVSYTRFSFFPHMEQSYVWMAACGCHKKQSWKQWRGMVRFVLLLFAVLQKCSLCWRSSCWVMISFCIQRGNARMVVEIFIKQSDLLAVWGWWVFSFHHSYIWTCGHMERISTLGTSIIWSQQWSYAMGTSAVDPSKVLCKAFSWWISLPFT